MKLKFRDMQIVGVLISAMAVFGSTAALAQISATPWVGPLEIHFSTPLQSNTPISAIVPVPSCAYQQGPTVNPADVQTSRNGQQIEIEIGHGDLICLSVGTMRTWEYTVPLGNLPSGNYTVNAGIYFAESPASRAEYSAPLSVAVGPAPVASTALPVSSTWSAALLAILLGSSGLLLARRRLRA